MKNKWSKLPGFWWWFSLTQIANAFLLDGSWRIGLLGFWSGYFAYTTHLYVNKLKKRRQHNGSNRGAVANSGDTRPSGTGTATGYSGTTTSNTANTTSASIRLATVDELERRAQHHLAIEHRDEPFVAYKRAWLTYAPGKQKVLFTGVGIDQRYETEATFVCGAMRVHFQLSSPFNPVAPAPEHQKPAVNCRCGFYGYKNYFDMAKAGWGGMATLEVELYGTVIEHELGYRAEKQRVLAVYVDPQCASALCDTNASWFGLDVPSVERAPLYPYCDEHAALLPRSAMHTPIQIPTLANLLGTEVKWAKEKGQPA